MEKLKNIKRNFPTTKELEDDRIYWPIEECLKKLDRREKAVKDESEKR